MANGRLGKANVAGNVTTAVYTNSSGAEASVSIIAFSKDGSDMHLRIDNTSNSLTSSTTLVSETYNERFIRYNASNTGFDDPAPVYTSKFSFADTTTNLNIDQAFEAYVQSNTTTYSRRSNSSEYFNCVEFMPYESFLDIWGSNTEHTAMGGSAYRQLQSFPLPVNEEEYYDRFIQGTSTGRTAQSSLDYYTWGESMDPWEKDIPWCMGMQGNGYLAAVSVNPSNYAQFGNTNNTSDSWCYQRVTTSWGSHEPSATYNYKWLHTQKRVACIEASFQNNRFIALNYFRSNTWDDDVSYNSRVTYMTRDDERRIIRFQPGAQRNGGNIVYFQYNPTDSSHYLCVYDNGNYRLVRIDYATAFANLSSASTYDASLTSDNETRGIFELNSSLSLTIASPFEFSLNTYNTARCTFIGTTASPLWVLCFSRMNDTTAADVYYSTDLKTWTPSATYYGSDDYSVLAQQTNIVSNSGVVTASKSNIANLGTDGVLEYGTSFNQYERTGLVLSNGDRVLTYNSSIKPYTIQVMGYEGS